MSVKKTVRKTNKPKVKVAVSVDEDRLTLEEVQAIRSRLIPDDMHAVMRRAGPTTRIVAEGDSWFDYLPGLDVLMQLRRRHGYSIHSVATAGDTLENMAFGTRIDRKFQRETQPLERTLAAIREHAPRIVLLSGGGNDIAGTEFEAYLNHKDSGLTPLLRKGYLKETLKAFEIAYRHIASEIWKVDDGIHVILHGYGYPVPDGRAVINFPFGFRFVGPWLRPALAKKNITSRQEGTGILVELIDEFNAMLSVFASGDPRLHYINLRDSIGDDDWVNELHLKNSAYGRVADLFHEEILTI